MLEHLRIKNQYKKITRLEYLTKFNILNNLSQGELKSIVLNFSFKDIQFNKQKIIPFFFILELLTGQKSSGTFSKKSVMFLKIRKGDLTGCKVTLRDKSLYRFFDYFLLALPRLETFSGFLKKKTRRSLNSLTLVLDDLFIFYPVEADINQDIRYLQINFIFNTKSLLKQLFILNNFNFPINKK